MPFMPLTAGDNGVKSVEKISFSSTLGAGACSIFIVKPMITIPVIAAYSYVERDQTLQIEGMTRLNTGSDDKLPFLGFIGLAAGTGANTSFYSQIKTVYG
jgi:hypothetical protein